jgi:ElaB/YqjD/DUF883 family membrane-anchored ribosome-binding protein
MNVGTTAYNGESTSADKAQEFRERLGPKLEEAQVQMREANERVKTFVQKNPAVTLLVAASIGFAIGRWASRR